SEHHVEPGHLEILQLVEPKLIVGRRERGGENKTQGWEGDQPVHLNAGARVFTAPTAKKREAQSSATNGRPEDRVAGRTGGEPWRVIAEARTALLPVVRDSRPSQARKRHARLRQ